MKVFALVLIHLLSWVSAAGMTLYKSPYCGCCAVWQEQAEAKGWQFNVQLEDNMHLVKDRYQLPPELGSCHTVVDDQGFVFEGHIPLADIENFLANPPEGAKGLLVPGMPALSPGMAPEGVAPAGFDVLLWHHDGSLSLFNRY